MSGFTNRDTKTYFNILGGKFSIRVPEGTEGSVSRVNKVGNTVHEVYHENFEGLLVGIRVTDSVEYGKSWNFDFVAGGEDYTLKLSYSNSFAVAILKMLPNIDLSKPFKLSPVSKVVDGKTQSSLFINQDGQAVKHAYTRENPNGMPDLEKIKVKGKDTWDDSERLEFLENMVITDIAPKLEGNKYQKAPVILQSDLEDDVEFGFESNDEDEEVNPEDLPF